MRTPSRTCRGKATGIFYSTGIFWSISVYKSHNNIILYFIIINVLAQKKVVVLIFPYRFNYSPHDVVDVVSDFSRFNTARVATLFVNVSATRVFLITFYVYLQGVAFINDINLGRYWPVGGPQVTLFVPAPFLKPPPATNTLVMFELENAPKDLYVKFVDTPVLNGTITV